jgi:hypothetical protein
MNYWASYFWASYFWASYYWRGTGSAPVVVNPVKTISAEPRNFALYAEPRSTSVSAIPATNRSFQIQAEPR